MHAGGGGDLPHALDRLPHAAMSEGKPKKQPSRDIRGFFVWVWAFVEKGSCFSNWAGGKAEQT